MGIIHKVGKYIKSSILNLEYEEIVITRQVIESIMDMAKQAHPKEFIILLKGDVHNNKLVISSLVYQSYQASENSSVMMMNLPLMSGVRGSCHSHPSYSNSPSSEDLKFFNKHPGLHLIICRPYGISNMASYDTYGKNIHFRII